MQSSDCVWQHKGQESSGRIESAAALSLTRGGCVRCYFHNTSEGMHYMNSNGKNRYPGRSAHVSIRMARIAAAGLISVASLALAWATSRSTGSRTDIDIKPPQPTSLHTKPRSGNRRHGTSAGHHAVKQRAKLHGHGQQSAQNGVSQGRNSTGGKHGNHPQSNTTPTPTPQETLTPSPSSTPGSRPLTSPVSVDVD